MEYENACTKDYDFPLKRESHFTDDCVMTAAVCRAILNNGENIGRFGIRKRGFEYATQYKQNFARYPHAGYGSMFTHWAKEKGFRRQYSYANITGGIADAFYKDIPKEIKQFCDSRIDISIRETVRELINKLDL